MNMKHVVVALGVVLGAFGAASVSAGEVEDRISERLTQAVPGLKVVSVKESEAKGLYEVQSNNGDTIYATEDGQYLMAEQAYRAANQPFTTVTELRLIEGMTQEIYQALRPHVAALPVNGAGINVNTATAMVIRSLHEELTDAQAASILEKREEERFENLQDFLALPEFAGLGLKSVGLGLQTRFFEVASRITYDNRVVNMVSTVFRTPEGEVQTVNRDTGQKNRITKGPFTISEG
mgnify:CR=1 FL=1